MQIRSRPLVLIYSALNAVGVLLLALAFLAPQVWHPLIIVIDGATVGRVVFLAIPIGLLVARAFGKVAAEPKRSVRRYLRVSQVFLFVIWIMACLRIASFVVTFHAWPVTILHGPDTKQAKEGFASVFGGNAASGISGIYFAQLYVIAEHNIYMRFNVDDPERLSILAEAVGVDTYMLSLPTSPILTGPAWWEWQSLDEESLIFGNDILEDTEYWRVLWLPKGSSTAFYYEYRRPDIPPPDPAVLNKRIGEIMRRSN